MRDSHSVGHRAVVVVHSCKVDPPAPTVVVEVPTNEDFG